MQFKAAIFDLDGTLIDSMGVWDKIDVDFLAKRGIPVPEDYGAVICSLSFQEAAAYTAERFHLPQTPEEIAAEWHAMAEDEYRHHVRLKPHAGEYLRALRGQGVRLSTASALSHRLADAVLENNGVRDLFDCYCSTDEVGVGKQSPEVFLLAARKLGVEPEHCAVFEDILAGVRSAKAAGMTAVGVFDRASAADESAIRAIADRYIYDYQELL